jgi:hypothetical protein
MDAGRDGETVMTKSREKDGAQGISGGHALPGGVVDLPSRGLERAVRPPGADRPIDPKRAMVIHLVHGGRNGRPETKGGLWAHTHGLGSYGLPELEIRHVPPMFTRAAGLLLNEVADYLLNSATKPLLVGQRCSLGGSDFLVAKAGPDDGDFWGGARRVQLVSAPLACECCDESGIPGTGP